MIPAGIKGLQWKEKVTVAVKWVEGLLAVG